VIDTETLRQHWPDVLEAVKREGRVAWILLNAASVDSLEGGVLTVAFAREGEAKGFAASGHDKVLTGVLATMLGLKVRVRALGGGGSGPRGAARPAPADPAPGTGTGGRAGAPGGTSDRGDDSAGGSGGGSGGTSGRPGRPGAGAASGTPAGGHQSAPGGAAAADGPGRGAPAASRMPEPRSGGGTSSSSGPAAGGSLEEEWPDDAGPADTPPGPTGMELIERQLGGTVIEEIEEP
jgi:DNA polymerase-3 subunit gamma/tau